MLCLAVLVGKHTTLNEILITRLCQKSQKEHMVIPGKTAFKGQLPSFHSSSAETETCKWNKDRGTRDYNTATHTPRRKLHSRRKNLNFFSIVQNILMHKRQNKW